MATTRAPRHCKAGRFNHKQKMINEALAKGFTVTDITRDMVLLRRDRGNTHDQGVIVNMVIEGSKFFPRSSSISYLKGDGKLRREA